MTTDRDPQSDVSKQRPPSEARIAEIEAGIVKPTPFEQAYLEERAAQSGAAQDADSDPNPWEKTYVRNEIEVPPSLRGPWYNPHPGSMANVQRAIRPALYVNTGYLLLSAISAFAPGALPLPVFLSGLVVVILVISVLVMLWAARGSLVAHYLIIATNTTNIGPVIDRFREGEYATAAIAGSLLAALYTFWLISMAAVTRYEHFRQGKLDV